MLKNTSSVSRNLIGFVSSVVVGISVFYVLDLSFFERFIFSFILSSMTFLIYKLLLDKDADNQTYGLETTSSAKLKDFLFIIFSVISVLSVILIRPLGDSLYFDWASIPIANWVRLISAIFLASFVPGYIILHFIDRRNQLKGVEVLVFSYLISLFFVPLLGYITILSSLSLSEYGSLLQLGFNLILLSAFAIHIGVNGLKKENLKVKLTLDRHSVYIILALSLICLFVLMGEWTIRNYTLLVPVTDFGEHLGNALRLLDGKFVFQTSTYNPELWFHLYLGSFLNLSGFPAINAYTALSFLVVAPYLAIFAMVSAFFSRESKKIPVIATFFALLSGFGWIFVLTNLSSTTGWLNVLQTGALKTYDTFPTFPNEPVPVYIIGLPILFMLLYLAINNKLSGLTRFSLFSILIAVDFLAHGGAELVFFMPIFFVLAVISRQEFISSMKKLSIAILLGSVLVIGLLVSGKFNVIDPFNPSGFITSIIYLSIFVSAVTLVILQYRNLIFLAISKIKNYFKYRIAGKISIVSPQNFKLRKVVTFGAISALIYFYGLSFIIWAQILPIFQSDQVAGYYTPFYFVPMRLGVSGLLVLAYLILLLIANKKIKRGDSCFIIIMFAPILFENLINFLSNDPTILSLTRFWFYFPTFVGVLAAVAIVRFASRLQKGNLQRKIVNFQPSLNSKILISILLLFIVTFGSFSSLLSIERLTLLGDSSSHLSSEELKALDYIRKNSASDVNTSIATLTDTSYQILQRFGEVRQPQIAGSTILFSLKSSESVLFILSKSKVEFIYMDQRDFTELTNVYRDSYMATLLDYLPIAFKNADVTIYEVPANVSRIIPSNMSEPTLTMLTKDLDIPTLVDESSDSSHFIYISNYACFFGHAAFQGNVTLTTDFFGLIGPASVKSVDISQTTVNSGQTNNFDIDNISIIDIKYNNSIISTLTSTDVSTLQYSQGSLTSFDFPVGFNLTMNLSGNASVFLTLKKNVDGTIFYVTVQNGTLRFSNVFPTFVVLKNPLIDTKGTTSFDGNTYIKSNQASFQNLFPISPIVIQGYSSFKIEFSDSPTFISDFSYNGTYTVPSSIKAPNWNSLTSIPWISVLVSPFNIILIIVVIGFVIVLSIKKANNFTIYLDKKQKSLNEQFSEPT